MLCCVQYAHHCGEVVTMHRISQCKPLNFLARLMLWLFGVCLIYLQEYRHVCIDSKQHRPGVQLGGAG
jgi:hypothetical protein